MDKQILQDIAPEFREQVLIDNAEGCEKMGYTKPMTKEQLEATRKELADEVISLNQVKEEKKASNQIFNEKIKGHKNAIQDAAEKIKAKGKYIVGKCYKMIDREAKMAGYYSPEGALVYEREAEDEELQLNMFAKTVNMRKTGTDDK